MKRLFGIAILFCCVACAKPLMSAKLKANLEYKKMTVEANANESYYAVRDALAIAGYSVADEDLPGGTITTSWVATTSDSHYIPFFRR